MRFRPGHPDTALFYLFPHIYRMTLRGTHATPRLNKCASHNLCTGARTIYKKSMKKVGINVALLQKIANFVAYKSTRQRYWCNIIYHYL